MSKYVIFHILSSSGERPTGLSGIASPLW
jgi:hypothetical protein